ncbi:Lrp/AsnC ligand binding domain-containing protein [Arenibacterium sp. LLYu02]|uniref:Lrp/AsnC ligand binding domain-containing protein n=1 Tax=Arenibacterium sp. LLYu02 TaxID=3404132 RepID=UPI003B2109C7
MCRPQQVGRITDKTCDVEPEVGYRPKIRKKHVKLHTVAGNGCVVIKVRAIYTEGQESFLMDIQSLDGVRSVRSYIALSTFLERGPAPD